MSRAACFVPYVSSARRFLFLAEREARRQCLPADAEAYRIRRLEEPGTSLWRRLPGRVQLLAAGVLAVEEVLGAGVDELRVYGLKPPVAQALITILERIDMTTFFYGPRAGQIYDQDPVTIVANDTRATSFTSDTYETGDRGTLRLDLVVSAITGTGARLHVQIETRDSHDSGNWRVVDAFVDVTAAGSEHRDMGGVGRFVRAVCTFTGTSATYSVTGNAV